MSLPVAIIIPARYDSKRFPGKPVRAVINGISLIERVWRLATTLDNVASVHVATDHEDIARHVAGFGGAVLMTDPALPSGTDRAFAALQHLPSSIGAVVNLQGDAPLTPPWVIQALVDAIADEKGPAIVTPAVALTGQLVTALRQAKEAAPSSGTTVVVSRSGRALYFSKYILPFARGDHPAPVLRHIGLYAYKRAALQQLVALPPSKLERAEGLEQLRALEADIPIQVIEVDYRGRTHHSIDHPNDIAIAEDILRREGEF